MVKYTSTKQLSFEAFKTPFQRGLDPKNRWIRLAEMIPWDALAKIYMEKLCIDFGRPAIKPRVVIGAMIIKHKKSLSDEATIEEIRENPYLQYFIGNRENRKYLKSKGIRFSGKPLGRPVKLSQKDVKQELS